MPPLSEFEKQRQANIARNKALLQKLNLNAISNDISTEIKRESPNPIPAKRRKTEPKKKEPIVATRRSRRIAGVKLEETEEGRQMLAEAEEAKRKNEELERLKNVRLSGDLRLIDLLSDASGIKLENGEQDDNLILNKFNNIGKSISMGDFYETVVKRTVENDESVDSVRASFDDLKIWPKFNPLEIKVTPNRMTSIAWHPSADRKLVAGGDTAGYLGLWTFDSDDVEKADEDEQPDVSIMKIHGKTVAKVGMNSTEPSKMYTASYDGSIRSIDLKTLKTAQVFALDDQYGDAVGVSDVNFSVQDPNLCYFTTLSGQFCIKDLRTKGNETQMDLLRMHDKKIGGFSVNPNFDKQIVTASLDRSLKIWDLRNIQSRAKHSFYHPDDQAPHLMGSYASRLSISCADWNSSGDILCNGYDDTICVFNLGDTTGLAKDYQWSHLPRNEYLHEKDAEAFVNLNPDHRLRHNCQTGRWVSILKSKWQQNPKDGVEKFVIANMNRYFDIYTANGIQVAHLGDAELVGAVPAAVAIHPTENWVVGGSASGKGYVYV